MIHCIYTHPHRITLKIMDPTREEYLQKANTLISLVEKFEMDTHIDEYKPESYFIASSEELDTILMTFIQEHGVRVVTDALPTFLISRDVSHWTLWAIANFCDHGINDKYYFFGCALKQVMRVQMTQKVKLQLCAKRFLARKKLAELKKGDSCAICVGPLLITRRHTSNCTWKEICSMCWSLHTQK